MIGVDAVSGSLVVLCARRRFTVAPLPVALGLPYGRSAGKPGSPRLEVSALRIVFVVILILIAADM